MQYIVPVIVLLVAGLGLWLFWRRRQRRADGIISLVALLREPISFDSAVLAGAARRAWNADLGDGSNTGEEGFVTMTDIVGMIQYHGRHYLINCRPHPYVDDPQESAESIVNLRIQELFRAHRAWFSFDAMSVGGGSHTEDPTAAYGLIAKLLAEFIDDNCLLILDPETGEAWPINEDTEKALLADDPIAALQAARAVPVTTIADDDPLMREAVAKARSTWPEFLAGFESRTGDDFLVKAPVTAGGNTEFIWITVTAIEGEQILGRLANDPIKLGALKLDSKVVVKLSELNDWCYIDGDGKPHGAFTLAPLQKAAQRR